VSALPDPVDMSSGRSPAESAAELESSGGDPAATGAAAI